MSDKRNGTGPRPDDYPDTPVAPADIASAGRSCSAIIILVAVILLILCVSIAIRWATAR